MDTLKSLGSTLIGIIIWGAIGVLIFGGNTDTSKNSYTNSTDDSGEYSTLYEEETLDDDTNTYEYDSSFDSYSEYLNDSEDYTELGSSNTDDYYSSGSYDYEDYDYSGIDTYTNTYGNEVPSPSYENYGNPTAICSDGTYSYSQSRSGTCSYHGGVSVWY